MATKKTVKKKAIISSSELIRGFITFSIVYLPVSVLFLNNGRLEEALLAVFTLLLGATGLTLIAKYIWIVGEFLNGTRKKRGDLFRSYFTMAFIPLAMFKVFAYVILGLLPTSHSNELLCDIRHFVLDLYRITDPQFILNYLLLGSLVFVGLLAIRTLTED